MKGKGPGQATSKKDFSKKSFDPLQKSLLTAPQCTFLKDFKTATLFPTSDESIQVVPAHNESFSVEEICGNLRIGSPPVELINQKSLIRCELCQENRDDLCPVHPLTLILDIPVCRDGSVTERARYTAPRPLFVAKSRNKLEVEGIWTPFAFPPQLLFGPYEGIYCEKSWKCPITQENSCLHVVHLVKRFIDASVLSVSNWLSFVSTTSEKSRANLTAFLFKGAVFYKTFKPIDRNTELVVWTEHDDFSKEWIQSNCNLKSNTPSLDCPHQCDWCKFQFCDAYHLIQHKQLCTLKEEAEESDPVPPLRRSERLNKMTAETAPQAASAIASPPTPRDVTLMKDDSYCFECMYCGEVFKCRESLLRHVKSHENAVSFECSECGVSCCDRASLNRHVHDIHIDPLMDYPEELRIDRNFLKLKADRDKCESLTSKSSPVLVEKDYNYHLGSEFSVFDLPWVQTLLKINKTIRQNRSNSLRCSSCHLQFYNRLGAKLHERKCMEGRRPYKCGHCGKRFQLYFSIVKHMKNHTDIEREILINSECSSFISQKPLRSDENKSNLSQDLETSKAVLSVGSTVSTKECSSSFVQDKIERNLTKRSLESYNNSKEETHPKDITKVDPDIKIENHSLDGSQSPVQENSSNEDNDVSEKDSASSHNPESELMIRLNCSNSNLGGRRRRHECNICGQRFYRMKHIKRHVELHENETSRVYKCSYCNLWFGSQNMVCNHEMTVHVNEPQSLVPEKLSGEEMFLRNLLTVLAKEGKKGKYCEYFNAKETLKDKKFECEICSKRFTSSYRVRKHKLITHADLMEMLEAANKMSFIQTGNIKESDIMAILTTMGDEYFIDDIKNLKFEQGQDGASAHNPYTQIQLTLLNSGQEGVRGGPQGPVISQTEVDENSLSSESTLDSSETRTKTPNNPSKLYAAKNFIDGQPTSGKLILPKGVEYEPVSTHSLLLTENPEEDTRVKYIYLQTDNYKSSDDHAFVIPSGGIDLKRVISETFANTSSDSVMSRHRQSYNEKDMKQCKICGKKLSPKTNMKAHLQSHTGERHYECQYCHKRYSLLSTLKRHIRIHTGDRPFKCSLCEKSYTQSSNLKRHYRQHTGERPFTCAYCPRRYAEKFSLNRHLKKHKEAKSYRCTVCRKGFSEQYLLQRHVQVGHNCN